MEADSNESETKVAENKEMSEDVAMASDDSDSDADNDTSSDDDDDTREVELNNECENLQKLIDENPYGYDNHIELIKKLGDLGDLDRLRAARKKMSELFPLTEDLWLAWLKDEIRLLEGDSERSEVISLFEKAVKDYLCVPIWLEFVQFAIGGVGKTEDKLKKIREIFDAALTACGLHVSKGALIWETYREYENAISVSALPRPLESATEEQMASFNEHQNKVKALFVRQLSVPLLDMEASFKEYEEWSETEADSNVKRLYQKALTKLEKIKPYEYKLELAVPPRLAEYQEYLKYEKKDGDPARVQCLYERCVQENCLNTAVWLDYTKYLDHTLRVPSVSIDVYDRSIRNCPWCVQLWQNYILTLERSAQPHDKVKGVFESALNAGFTQGTEYLAIWTTYTDYLRRRIKWEEDHADALESFRLSMEKAIEQLDYFGTEGDPNGSLRQCWAIVEAKFCKNMEKARELWLELMAAGRANEAALWMEYFRFERLYGDNKHCRRVLQKALNSVTDWPESIVDAYINFERIEGNLEQYEQASMKCEAQMERINERRAKTEGDNTDSKKKFDKKGNQKGKQQKGNKVPQKQQSGTSQKQQKPETSRQQNNVENVKPYKRKNDRSSETSNDGFKVPASIPSQSSKVAPPPGYKPDNDDQSDQSKIKSTPPPGSDVKKVAPPPGYKGDNNEVKRGPPPPGYKRSAEEMEGPPEKKSKTDSSSSLPTSSSIGYLTIFVSNLSFEVDEEQIKAFFNKCGAIDEIRLVKNFKGRSKGYAYVQFADQLAVNNALTYDRTPIDGRPMYVSRYESREEKSKADFKYPTSLEKNKLFIKNLPFTCTKEALTTLFSQHGEIKDVRLVTYRSGAPKGLAYVEFVDEQCATQAVMKTDRLMIGEHEISVAISNPPQRKAQRDETSFVPSLGGGKKETSSRGVARTQVMLMPRAVSKKPVSKPSSSSVTQKKNESTSETSNDSQNGAKSSGMSNSDFRNMLLKK